MFPNFMMIDMQAGSSHLLHKFPFVGSQGIWARVLPKFVINLAYAFFDIAPRKRPTQATENP